MMADKSRRAILVCAMLAMTTIALDTALAANAEDAPTSHKGPWPIRNGHNYQPTEHELRALHREDVTHDQAREIDRLYDQLLATGEKVRATAYPSR
jgi:Spy/CpxP family protein refolding chaperone